MHEPVVCERCREIIRGEDPKFLLDRPYHAACFDERKQEMLRNQEQVAVATVAIGEHERIQLEDRMIVLLKTAERYLQGKPMDGGSLLREITALLAELKRNGWKV